MIKSRLSLLLCAFSRHSALLLLMAMIARSGAAQLQPIIDSIRIDQTQIVVRVTAPPGVSQVVLESKAQLGQGAWIPRSVIRPIGDQSQSFDFRVPNQREFEWLRVTAGNQPALAEAFYQGTNQFPSTVSGSEVSAVVGGPRGDVLTPGADSGAGGEARTVAESDIWRVSNDRVYFFNALRGLQVVDAHDANHLKLEGQLSIPGAGEQMYLRENAVVVLLVNGGCYGAEGTAVWVVDARDAADPKVTAKLKIDGYILESRMVGDVLYVATQTYTAKVVGNETQYEAGTRLISFDLTNATAPVERANLWFPGYGNVVTATDTLCFVVTQKPDQWWKSTIRVVDITSPTGEMSPYVTIAAAGYIRDKFKLNLNGTRFTCISEEMQANPRQNRVETYFLADPRSVGPIAVAKQGELVLGKNESLFATRFDGDKAYIVTFQRIDPLWIVDLSDPTRPKIAGELEVPGWSTYIQPWGDRLVAVGSESNRVAVSLFDVSNPAKPSLKSRVLLGNNYSWSESAWNEKAVSILTEAGLVMVPFSGDTANGYANRVQIIDLEREKLALRGVVEHTMAPRRTALVSDHVFSISSQELLSIDVSDRDHPRVASELELSWPVNRVLIANGHLLEFEQAGYYYWGGGQNNQSVRIRVAQLDSPDQILSTLELPGMTVAGATVRANRLYILQSNIGGPSGAEEGLQALLTVVDVADPVHLKVLGKSVVRSDKQIAVGAADALWLENGILVWAGTGGGFFWAWDLPMARLSDVAYPWWGWGGGGTLLSFDVTDAAHPVWKSTVELNDPNGDFRRWGFSDAYSQGTLVFASHGESEVLTRTDPKTDVSVPALPYQQWIQRYFLDVIDFADPSFPTLREKIPLPAGLQGISHSGRVVYSFGNGQTSEGFADGTNVLTALSYDGVALRLIDTLKFASAWGWSIVIHPDAVLVARPDLESTTGTPQGLLETYQLGNNARFEKLGSLQVVSQLSQLVQRGNLLATSASDGSLRFFDISLPAEIKLLSTSQQVGCIWGSLESGDGQLEKGYWLPLYDYGVRSVLFENP